MSLLIWVGGSLAVVILLYLVGVANTNSVLWRRRKIVAEFALGLGLATFPFIYALDYLPPVQVLLTLLQLTLLLLCGRIIVDRAQMNFLRISTLQNVLAFLIFSVAIVVGSAIGVWLQLANSYQFLMFLCTMLSAAIGSVFLYQILWTLKHYRLRKIDKNLTLKEMPTVTLAIPARNETHALTDCLHAAVASDYEKLEIIVLDDCSQDKTSQIIRSFASVGVRFIQGATPSSQWLGKNQACQLLAEQASGDFVFYVGVDTRLEPQSVSKLMAYAVSNNVDMVSVLPQREDAFVASNLLQQLRYFWQIALPITKQRVPVASPAWLIRAKTLKKLGGFEAVKHKIMPEGSFARRLFATDQYRFIISNPELGITNAKKWSSQIESSLRVLYPTLKRQPFVAVAAMTALTFVLCAPYINLIILALHGSFGPLFWVSLIAALLLLVSYGLVIFRTNPRLWLVIIPFLPIVLLQEVALITISLLSYEFSEVNWKGRNVCYPVISYKK